MESLMDVSETVYEIALPTVMTRESTEESSSKVFFQSTEPNQVKFTSVLQKNNSNYIVPPLLPFKDVD